MSPIITVFENHHIFQALQLWETTEYIGLSSADSPDALAAFLERNPGLSFAAFEIDQLVGAILCGNDGRRGYIHHLAVSDRCRHQGIGSMLLSRSLMALAAIGITKCHALMFRDNPYGALFWGAGGWQLREDLLVYSKRLTDGAERNDSDGQE